MTSGVLERDGKERSSEIPVCQRMAKVSVTPTVLAGPSAGMRRTFQPGCVY